MIDYINSAFGKGRNIKISGIEGEFEGTIEHIGKDFLVLKDKNDAIRGIHISAIQTFATPDAIPPKFHTYPINPAGVAAKLYPTEIVEDNATNTTPVSNEDAERTTGNDEREGTEDTDNRYIKRFKPGDKIPLNELKQIDPGLEKQWKHSEQKKRQREMPEEIVQKLKELFDRIKEEERPEDKEILKAEGHIIEFQPTFNFAFIDDLHDGERCFFNKGDVVDTAILQESGTNIPVLFMRSRNFKGNAAKSIHRVMSVIEIIELATRLFSTGDSYRASQVLRNAQQQYPSNESLEQIIDFIDEVKGPDTRVPYDNRNDEGIEMAKKAKFGKDYERAIELYKDALQRKVGIELCIKEIMQLYCSMHNQETDPEKKAEIKKEAVDFIYKYRDELPHKAGAMGVLENVYYAFGLYDDHVEIVEDLVTQAGRRGDLSKYVFYLNKAAMCYWHLNDMERSIDACKQGLEVEPGNPHLLKTLQVIMKTSGYQQNQE